MRLIATTEPDQNLGEQHMCDNMEYMQETSSYLPDFNNHFSGDCQYDSAGNQIFQQDWLTAQTNFSKDSSISDFNTQLSHEFPVASPPAPETPFGPGILVKFPNWAWQSFCPRSPPPLSRKQIVNSSIIVSVRQMKVTKETSLDYSI